MAKKLFIHDGEPVFASELDVEIKSIQDAETKKLDDYQIEVIGSTPAIDRDGESITAEGWDLKNFKKNPVILLNHNYWGLPVAKAEGVKVQDGKLVFKVRFPEQGASAEADTVRKLVKSGFINASSVGFKAKEWKDGQSDKEARRTYLKQELLELSLVTVPANPEAVVSEKSFQPAIDKGVVTNEEIKNLITAIQNQKSVPVETYTREEIKQLISDIDAKIEKFKSEVEEAKKSFRETVEKIVIETIENKSIEDGYSKILFGEDGHKTSCLSLEKQIEEMKASLNATLKEVIQTTKKEK